MIPPTPPRDAGPPPPAAAADASTSSNDTGQRDGQTAEGAASSRSGNSARQPRRAGADELPPDDPARQQFQALMQGLPSPGGLGAAAPTAAGGLALPGPADGLLPRLGPADAPPQPMMPWPPGLDGAARDAQLAELDLAPAPSGPASAALQRPGPADELTHQVSDHADEPQTSPTRLPADDAGAAPQRPVEHGAADHSAAHRRHAAPHLSPEPDSPAAKTDDPLPSPMALFHPRVAEPQAAAPTRPDAPAHLPQAQDVATQLALHIERLAVSHSDDGQRRVRLAVAGDALPDTDIEIGEVGGEMQVMFFCRSADARRLLEPQAHTMAGWLAERLQRPVWLSVGGQQRDEPGRMQVHAQPGSSAAGAIA